MANPRREDVAPAEHTASNGKAIDESADVAHQESALKTETAAIVIEPYGPSGFRGIFATRYVTLCAAFSAIGGFLFGYDQGVISVTLTMDEFLGRFPDVSEHATGAGFKKGLMTAMITLGARQYHFSLYEPSSFTFWNVLE